MRCAEVYALYVKSSYKKMGIGKKLLEYIFTILKEKYTYVLISTLKQNSANNFYLKCGGKHIGTCLFKLDDTN